MKRRYYIAYGSNLNIPQMKHRCPDARILGTANIRGWVLLFKESKTGSYLTIEKREGGKVPVAIWEVTEDDEAALDRYEGYPSFYYKKDFKVTCRGIVTGRRKVVDAFAYIMHEDRPLGVPTAFYMQTCLEGYETFRFERSVLIAAFEKSKGGCKDEK